MRSLVGGFRLECARCYREIWFKSNSPALFPILWSSAPSFHSRDEHTDCTTLLQQSSAPDPSPSEPRRSISDVSDVTIHERTPAGEKSGSRFQGALIVDDNRGLEDKCCNKLQMHFVMRRKKKNILPDKLCVSSKTTEVEITILYSSYPTNLYSSKFSDITNTAVVSINQSLHIFYCCAQSNRLWAWLEKYISVCKMNKNIKI